MWIQNSFSRCGGLVTLALLTAVLPGRISATPATNILISVADTSLLEVAPTNNLGGYPGMNGGVTQEFKRNRALFRFDLSALPTNAIVVSASLQLVATRQPGFMEPINFRDFALHRMLVPWGEGNKNPSFQIGKGLPASPGEATWNYAFFPTNTWSTPGGASGVDFSSVESSFKFVEDASPTMYRFDSNPEMVADANYWVSHPHNNFGWILLCTDESTQSTARRWGTREDGGNEPLLEIGYLVPPKLYIQKTNDLQPQLHFTAWADHNYDVLYRNSLGSGNWLLLTNLVAVPTNYAALVIDSASVTQRFYRVSAY